MSIARLIRFVCISTVLFASDVAAQGGGPQPAPEEEVRKTIEDLLAEQKTEVVLQFRQSAIPLVFGAQSSAGFPNHLGASLRPPLYDGTTLRGQIIEARERDFRFRPRGRNPELLLFYQDVARVDQWAPVPTRPDQVPIALQQPHRKEDQVMRYAIEEIGGHYPLIEVTFTSPSAFPDPQQLDPSHEEPKVMGRKKKPYATIDPDRRSLVGKVISIDQDDFELDVGPTILRIAYGDLMGVGRYDPEMHPGPTARRIESVVRFPVRILEMFLYGLCNVR